MTDITGTTTIAELMRMGARITFGSGRSMAGDTRGGYIQVTNEFGSLGLWDMDAATGVEDAIADLTRDAAESRMTLHGVEILEADDEVEEEETEEEVA